MERKEEKTWAREEEKTENEEDEMKRRNTRVKRGEKTSQNAEMLGAITENQSK